MPIFDIVWTHIFEIRMLLLPIATLMAATAVEGRIRHRQVKNSFLYTKKNVEADKNKMYELRVK